MLTPTSGGKEEQTTSETPTRPSSTPTPDNCHKTMTNLRTVGNRKTTRGVTSLRFHQKHRHTMRRAINWCVRARSNDTRKHLRCFWANQQETLWRQEHPVCQNAMQRQSLIFGTPATVSTGVSRNTLFRCSAGYWTMCGPHADCIATNMSGEGQIDVGAMPPVVSCLLKTLSSRTQRWLLHLFWFAGGESLTRFNVRYQERGLVTIGAWKVLDNQRSVRSCCVSLPQPHERGD